MDKTLGKLNISATGLRRMANAIEKEYKTKGNVNLKCHITEYEGDRTFGV